MNPAAAHIAQSAANPAAAVAAHSARPLQRTGGQGVAPKPKPRAEDQFLSSTTAIDPAEALRSLKGNDQEEAHDDRSGQNGHHTKQEPHHPDRPKVDLKA